MTPRRLRIGHAAELGHLSDRTGHGRMWRVVLRGLAEHADLVPFPAPRRSRLRLSRRARADVYLGDGHQGAIDAPGPTVVHIHDVGWDTDELRATLDPTFRAGIEERTAEALAHSGDVITPSRATADAVITRYDIAPERVHVVPHGVDLDTFHPGAAGGADVLHAAGAEHHAPFVLFVSQVHPRKNLDVLRAAMVHLADQGLPHHLVIVGGAALDRADGAELLRAATADLPGHPGRVRRLEGLTDDQLAGVMAQASVMCLPSLMEGFGLTVLEAMACGTPVVVSDRGALPEVVGNAGVVVAPEVEPLRHALFDLLTDPPRRAAVASAGQQRAATFTWDRAIAGWLDVLAGAAARRARNASPVR